MSRAVLPLEATTTHASHSERVHSPGVSAATVVAVEEEGRLHVRVQHGDVTQRVEARLAHIAGYRPHEGDRVLVSGDGAATYVIAVLQPSEPLGLALDDGTRAVVNEGGLELRDGDNRILVRYAEGTARISAPRDLELAAPSGQVRIIAGTDVSMEAARDVYATGGRRVELNAAAQQKLELHPQRTHLEASRLHVDAKEARLATSRAQVIARDIATTAERIASHVETYELEAKKIVERSRDVFRTALGLLQLRANRKKVVVTDTMSVRARRTTIVSKQDTSIDGERVLLG